MIRPLATNWIGLNPTLAMRTLGHNLAIIGALFEAARRARIRCPACDEPPCEGQHPGLVGPCCICCPVPPVEPSTETLTAADPRSP